MNDQEGSDWIHFHDNLKRNPFFGEVQHRLIPDGRREVRVIIAPSGSIGFELACSALAVDGSKSMMPQFGAHLPPILRRNKNLINPLLIELASFLAKNSQGQVLATYWACGNEGADFEPLGLLQLGDLGGFAFTGPQNWGGGTQITPIVNYFWESVFSTVKGQSYALIVTDGAWSEKDQESLLDLTGEICNQIAAGSRDRVKFVVLAIRTETNTGDLDSIQARFTSLDDYEHPTGIDIWDHKWLHEITDYAELFVEMLQDTEMNIGGRVFADGVECYATDNLKFGFQFLIPATAPGFTLQISDMELYQAIQ